MTGQNFFKAFQWLEQELNFSSLFAVVDAAQAPDMLEELRFYLAESALSSLLQSAEYKSAESGPWLCDLSDICNQQLQCLLQRLIQEPSLSTSFILFQSDAALADLKKHLQQFIYSDIQPGSSISSASIGHFRVFDPRVLDAFLVYQERFNRAFSKPLQWILFAPDNPLLGNRYFKLWRKTSDDQQLLRQVLIDCETECFTEINACNRSFPEPGLDL